MQFADGDLGNHSVFWPATLENKYVLKSGEAGW